MLIDQGRKLAPIPEKYQHDDFRLKGCQSVVYFVAEREPMTKSLTWPNQTRRLFKGFGIVIVCVLRSHSKRDS